MKRGDNLSKLAKGSCWHSSFLKDGRKKRPPHSLALLFLRASRVAGEIQGQAASRNQGAMLLFGSKLS